jgi:hypothetical protein
MRTHTLTPLPFKYLTEVTYKKLYNDIIEFRTLFDLPIDKKVLSREEHRLHCDLFCEEQGELALATNRVDSIDAVIDSVYVYMGALVHIGKPWEVLVACSPLIAYPLESMLGSAEEMGFDFVEAWDIVHSSNISKLCTADNVDQTSQVYKSLGVSVVTELAFNNIHKGAKYRVKVARHCKDYHGKFYPQGKVLKSIGYTPAILTGL